MPVRFTAASVRQLKIFIAVVENGGFSAAQATLNTSAATISVQMKELEYQLGMTLCQRGRMGFKLTERGQQTYEATRNLLAAFDNFNLAIANIRDELVGEVRIGMQDNLATNNNFKLSDTVARFNSKENEVVFNIEEALAKEQETRTLEGRYNLAIGIFHHRIPGLDYTTLFSEDVALYCAKGHPLFAKAPSVAPQELKQCKLVGAGPIQSVLLKHEALFEQAAAVTENMDATVMMMLSGHYIAFLPAHYADIWVEKGMMRALCPEHTSSTVDFHMITKTGLHQPRVVEVFIDDLLRCHGIGEPDKRSRP